MTSIMDAAARETRRGMACTHSGKRSKTEEQTDMKRRNLHEKVFLLMLALMLALTCAAAADEQHFDAVTGEDGAVYDLFVITKLNYEEDHMEHVYVQWG